MRDKAETSTQGVDVIQYDISVTPNDFNVNTIFDLIKAGHIEMPVFQRNYVWDQKRASKLIESLILGLPIPQIFLYQKEKNIFSVIDGQQRLFTIYYFMKQRFPKEKKRVALRNIFAEKGYIPEDILSDNEFFQDFDLRLDSTDSNLKHPLHGLKYNTLKQFKSTLEFTTIRCTAIRQNSPDDDSSMFEIFSRLNTGGVNLNAEEIRVCLYYSDFYKMLYRVNSNDAWRRIWGKVTEDDRANDVDTLLRAFAMLCSHKNYASPMRNFLNRFARSAMGFSTERILYLEQLFISFLRACENIPPDVFLKRGKRFDASLLDAVFIAIAEPHLSSNSLIIEEANAEKISALKESEPFKMTHSTGHVKYVRSRIESAKTILSQH